MRWLEKPCKEHQWIAAAKAAVVELFNDSKRRRPDEVLASQGSSQGSLVMRCTPWGRTQYSRSNAKRQLVEPVVAQGFASSVKALFYQAIREQDSSSSPWRTCLGFRGYRQ